MNSLKRRLVKLGAAGTIGLAGLIFGNAIWNSDPVSLWRIRHSGFDPSKYTERDYLDAIVQIESGGRQNAKRYEGHIDDTSYGLGQLLSQTALDLQSRHPELPRLGKDVENSLCDPNTNLAYTQAMFREQMVRYKGNPLHAVAAYNAGTHAPFVAACQEMLNDVYRAGLDVDGSNGPDTRSAVKLFQRENGLAQDSRTGPEVYLALARNYKTKTKKDAPVGEIPANGRTPHHVLRFIRALEDNIHYLDPQGRPINLKK